MSIRVGLYDFFAYTIPGVFYLLVAWFGLTTFNIIGLDLTILNDLSIFIILILLGAGYILGQLVDPVAYNWLSFRKGSNEKARQKAFDAFGQNYPWIKLGFAPEEWKIIHYILKMNSPEVEKDLDQLNAIGIMMRNFSIGLLVTAVLFMLTFIFVHSHIGNLALAFITWLLSELALDRSDRRRRWFYNGILQAFAATHLFQEKKLDNRITITDSKPNPLPPASEPASTKESKETATLPNTTTNE